MTLSAQLAGFVVRTEYEDLSPHAAEMTKRCILDAIGVSIAASGLGEGCRAFVDLAREYDGQPRCTILGYSRKAPPEAAAFANGALAHAMDYEDSHDGALVHPNAPTVPAALAIAEGYAPVSGKELMTAVAVGCEVAVRLGLSLRVSLADFGWYPPPLLAAFGATAAAAKLLRLDERQVLDAFSLTLCQATCSGEIIHSPNSLLRAVRDAFPARAGVTSALLARRSVTGFEAPFEGRAGFFATFARGEYDPAVILTDLGKQFEIENISFKPWPSCRGTHAAIEAALLCRREHGIDPAQIEHVLVRGGRMLRMLGEPLETKQRPATAIDAKFSLPFTTATALLKGRVGLQDFLAPALADSEVLRLAAKVAVDPDFAATTAIGAVLEIRLRDGRSCRQAIDTPLGAPANPMSLEALLGKFSECATYAADPIDAACAHRFAQSVLSMETLTDSDTELLPLLRPRQAAGAATASHQRIL